MASTSPTSWDPPFEASPNQSNTHKDRAKERGHHTFHLHGRAFYYKASHGSIRLEAAPDNAETHVRQGYRMYYNRGTSPMDPTPQMLESYDAIFVFVTTLVHACVQLCPQLMGDPQFEEELNRLRRKRDLSQEHERQLRARRAAEVESLRRKCNGQMPNVARYR
ncbi:MAG: hypothetical protein Q9162_006782 [Coniocarpon cinnabarinum]